MLKTQAWRDTAPRLFAETFCGPNRDWPALASRLRRFGLPLHGAITADGGPRVVTSVTTRRPPTPTELFRVSSSTEPGWFWSDALIHAWAVGTVLHKSGTLRLQRGTRIRRVLASAEIHASSLTVHGLTPGEFFVDPKDITAINDPDNPLFTELLGVAAGKTYRTNNTRNKENS